MVKRRVSGDDSVLLMSSKVIHGRPRPRLRCIHADDVQGTLPEGELPEEHGGELIGYSPVPVPKRKPRTEHTM